MTRKKQWATHEVDLIFESGIEVTVKTDSAGLDLLKGCLESKLVRARVELTKD